MATSAPLRLEMQLLKEFTTSHPQAADEQSHRQDFLRMRVRTGFTPENCDHVFIRGQVAPALCSACQAG